MELHFDPAYTLFPDFVSKDQRLTPSEKCIYSTVFFFSQTERGCFASNRYFADRFGLSPSTVSHAITRLERMGYLRREVDLKTGARMLTLPFSNAIDSSCTSA